MDLAKLATEGRLPESMAIDQASTAEILGIINQQDQTVAAAVAREIPQIARAVDLITAALRQGGRLIYAGAGTSGRLGVLDAMELSPTFGIPADQVQALMAGGVAAVTQMRDGAEDSREWGAADVRRAARPGDVVAGIAASGRTPYTLAALETARAMGCGTVAIVNSADSPMAAVADVAITPLVGPEVITGSTRLKAGTAQKMVLNMLSTAVMIRLGKVYSNLMVDMQCLNEKLYQRAIRMVSQATGANDAAAEDALNRCNRHAKTAIVMLLAQVSPALAAEALAACAGQVHAALERLGSRSSPQHPTFD